MNEKEQEVDFDAFVGAVRDVNLDDEMVHEAAHSTAVSTRVWKQPESEQK
jgi:hypothetical protein